MDVQGKPGSISRRAFLGVSGGAAAALLLSGGPLHSLGARGALGQTAPRTTGYGPLVVKGDLALPAEFDYVVIDRQTGPMRDGNPTPGIFDGMAAFPGQAGDDDGDDGAGRTTILIRNHENRERPGEIPVIVPPDKAYDYPSTVGGNTKLIVRRGPDGVPLPVAQNDKFAILGGTSTNCAGGIVGRSWVTSEEVVKGPSGGSDGKVSAKRHGYNFEVPAYADGPVEAEPILAAGRFSHEAVAFLDGILYETEDRNIEPDPTAPGQPRRKPQTGACFYRFIPNGFGRNDNERGNGEEPRLADARGRLQALKLKDEFHANMDVGRVVGKPYDVEWVTVDDPDHDDDTDFRKDRQRGFISTRIQAQDKGAAFFDREEGIWVARSGDDDKNAKIYFDCTTGGAPLKKGQVWEFDPRRRTITLIYQSTDVARLDNPDNIVIVPQTGDIFLQEDGPAPQYVRGLTQEGEIYDFAQTVTNDTEFCGGCFDPDGRVLYLNQQGERGSASDPTDVAPGLEAVTYAIFGPFGSRQGADTDEEDDD